MTAAFLLAAALTQPDFFVRPDIETFLVKRGQFGRDRIYLRSRVLIKKIEIKGLGEEGRPVGGFYCEFCSDRRQAVITVSPSWEIEETGFRVMGGVKKYPKEILIKINPHGIFPNERQVRIKYRRRR